MLSDQTIKIVKSTAPVLVENGELLTRHFYKRMFQKNSEVKHFFNTSNQTAGTQQRALAGAIVAYALNIDNLEALGPAVELMAQKHASLGVKEEHYPIVGENLLASIQEVLGEAATDEIISAWAEAYGFLQGVLTGRENQIYQEHNSKFGWEGFKDFRIDRIEKESDCISSFYLCPVDGTPLVAHKPGQYITLRFPTPDGITTMRNYSLSTMHDPNHFRISVKHERGQDEGVSDGYVSSLLHTKVEKDQVIEVAPPCGEFFLQEETIKNSKKPIVLLSGGVGITPIIPMLQNFAQSDAACSLYFVHGCLSPKFQAFENEIEEHARQLGDSLHIEFRYSERHDQEVVKSSNFANISDGLIDIEFLKETLPSLDCEFYICGPKPFMQNLFSPLQVAGIPAEQIHFEFFGPLEDLKSTETETVC